MQHVEEGWAAFAELKAEGVLRHIGVSNFDVDQLRRAQAIAPMCSGLLTGAMTRERIAGLPDNDWRKRDERFQEPELSRHMAQVERLKAADIVLSAEDVEQIETSQR